MVRGMRCRSSAGTLAYFAGVPRRWWGCCSTKARRSFSRISVPRPSVLDGIAPCDDAARYRPLAGEEAANAAEWRAKLSPSTPSP